VPAAPTHRTRSTAGVLAVLSCAAVLTLSACDTSSETAPAGGSGHEGGHQAPHSGTHPTSQHHTVAPTGPSGEFNPQNCPTGRVC
jgi:hypothetical protein